MTEVKMIGVFQNHLIKSIKIGESVIFQYCRMIFDGQDNRPSLLPFNLTQGIVLSIVLNTDFDRRIIGTAIVVAPGVALTAYHIFEPIIDDIISKRSDVFCVGLTQGDVNIWRIYQLRLDNEPGDIAILTLISASKMPTENKYWQASLSTRSPMPGEYITLIGYRFSSYEIEENHFLDQPRALNSLGTYGVNLLISRGKVKTNYSARRDRFFVKWPTIEVECGCVGGMSGGGAFDAAGNLVGIISTGFDTEDLAGPSYVSKLHHALTRSISPIWPPKFQNDPVALIDHPVCAIEGRSKLRTIKINGDHAIEFEIW